MTTSKDQKLNKRREAFLNKCRFKCEDNQTNSTKLTYSEDNLYALGIRENSVTLYSQQVRALNLIYCLYEFDKRLKEGDKIAVIGGGLSGITAAAAAAVLGIKVDLFEQRTSLCHLQGSCTTRWVDPYIYDWPEPGSNNPYAGLPLLTWRSGIVASVIDKIFKQFFQNFVEFDYKKISNITLYLGASAKLITMENKLQVFWDNAIIPENNKNRNKPDSRGGNKEYDTIILATGFGIERKVENGLTTSYWRNDTFNQPEPGVTSEKPTTFLISGTGDGGLIDLLRVRLHNFKQSSIIDELIMSDDIDDYWIINLLKSRDILEIKPSEFEEFQKEYKDFYNEDISHDLDEEKYKYLIQNITNYLKEIKNEDLQRVSLYKKIAKKPFWKSLKGRKRKKVINFIIEKAKKEMNWQRKRLIEELQGIGKEAKKNPKINDYNKTWLFKEYEKLKTSICEEKKHKKDEKLKTSICEEKKQWYKYTFLDYLDYKIQRKLRDDTTAILNAGSPTFSLALRLDNASLFNTFITYRLYQLKAFTYMSGRCFVKSKNEVLIVNKKSRRTYTFDHLIIRHGPDGEQVLINLGLDKETVKTILKNKNPLPVTRLWEPGFYEKKIQEWNPNYFDREFIAPLTQLMAEDFLSSLRSRLEEFDGNSESQDNGLVLALHRVLQIDDHYYIQHIAVDGDKSDSENLSGIVWPINKGLASLSFYKQIALKVAKNPHLDLDDKKWEKFWERLKIETKDSSFRNFKSCFTIPFYASSQEKNQNKVALILFISSDKPKLCDDKTCLNIIWQDCKRFVDKINHRFTKGKIWCASSSFPDIKHSKEDQQEFQDILKNYGDIVTELKNPLHPDNLEKLTFNEKIQSFDFVVRE